MTGKREKIYDMGKSALSKQNSIDVEHPDIKVRE